MPGSKKCLIIVISLSTAENAAKCRDRLVIGSAQSKNDHLKLEVDVDVELTKSFASWLVTYLTKNYGRR